jgi:uncharacterized protein YpmB
MKEKRIIWMGLIVLALSFLTITGVLIKKQENTRSETNQKIDRRLDLVLSNGALHQWGFDEGTGKNKEKLGVEIPEDEVGNIAMHMHTARMNASDMQETIDITTTIQEITRIIESCLNINFVEDTM